MQKTFCLLLLEPSVVGRFESEHCRVRNYLDLPVWGVPCFNSFGRLSWGWGEQGAVLCSWGGEGLGFLPRPPFLELLCLLSAQLEVDGPFLPEL